MWQSGVIGIPRKDEKDKYTAVHYLMRTYKIKSKYGMESGKIVRMVLKIKDEIVLDYDKGWNVKPNCEEAEIATQILIFSNEKKEEEAD